MLTCLWTGRWSKCGGTTTSTLRKTAVFRSPASTRRTSIIWPKRSMKPPNKSPFFRRLLDRHIPLVTFIRKETKKAGRRTGYCSSLAHIPETGKKNQAWLPIFAGVPWISQGFLEDNSIFRAATFLSNEKRATQKRSWKPMGGMIEPF